MSLVHNDTCVYMKVMDKRPFHIKLTDEERAKLEHLRRRMGLRSCADVVRELIAREGGE